MKRAGQRSGGVHVLCVLSAAASDLCARGRTEGAVTVKGSWGQLRWRRRAGEQSRAETGLDWTGWSELETGLTDAVVDLPASTGGLDIMRDARLLGNTVPLN
jgi:hypothetical protein